MDWHCHDPEMTIVRQVYVFKNARTRYINECSKENIRPRGKKKRLFKEIQGKNVTVVKKGPVVFCVDVETTIYPFMFKEAKCQNTKSKSETMLRKITAKIVSLISGL